MRVTKEIVKAEKAQPIVSVIVVSYNYADLLPRALDALSRQIFRDFEIVLVNNGSTDNTAEVINLFCSSHSELSINLINIQINNGLMQGRNTGLAKARGKYLIYNDADDWMDENCLELLVEKAIESDADRIIGSFRVVTPDNKIIKKQIAKSNSSRWYYNMIQVTLFKRLIFVENNINFGNLLWDDFEITTRYNRITSRIAYVDICCYNYLLHPSASHNQNLYKFIWEESRSLSSILMCWRSTYDTITDEKDKLAAEYQIVKIYYYYIFLNLQSAPLNAKWENYDKLQVIMQSFFPKYKRSKYINLLQKTKANFNGRCIVWIAVCCEKLYVMKFVLLVYHLLNKIINFKY